MTKSTGQRRHHFKNHVPKDPAITPFAEWLPCNQSFHKGFYQWLKQGGYGPTALNTYLVASRLALGYLNRPYWHLDPDTDLEKVRAYLQTTPFSVSTQREYGKGLKKLAEYVCLRQNRPSRARPVNWPHHLEGLPAWLAEHVRDFVAHKRKGWPPEEHHRLTCEALSRLCLTLRGMVGETPPDSLRDLTPARWFDYQEKRLAENIHPNTLNAQLGALKAFLHFLDEAGEPVCTRLFLVEAFHTGPRLPKDAPPAHLRRLLEEIETETIAAHASSGRMGVLDRAWVLLMLFSGLRTCEVRRLKLSDINWASRRVRIEQSKGLKDRLVYLNAATVEALQVWLTIRGESELQSDHVFLYRHRPLSRRYCQVRLRTYARRTGVHITPHQLRHSCATLLLNAGAPVVTVQTLLGHEKIDTTLGYARLYDGTVAADYYRAMGTVERLMDLPEDGGAQTQNPGELLALVEALGNGTLNPGQREILQALRTGILALVEREQM